MLSEAHTPSTKCSWIHRFISGTNSGRKGLELLTQKPALFGCLGAGTQLLGFPMPKHIYLFGEWGRGCRKVFFVFVCFVFKKFFFKADIHFYLFIYLFIFWLCWVFVSVRGLSPVAASGGHSSSRCAGLSPLRPLPLRSTGSRRAGSVVVAHGPSCSAACGILPDQGWNPRPLHQQADSQPLRHQGSPKIFFLLYF